MMIIIIYQHIYMPSQASKTVTSDLYEGGLNLAMQRRSILF